MSESQQAYERNGRAFRRAALQAHGVKERRAKSVYRVQIDVIPMPEWAAKRALRGLSHSTSHVWLNRGDADFLAKLDREAGGQPTIIEAEYRVCRVCQSVKLGQDAVDRRLLDESYCGQEKPCDDNCLNRARRHQIK